MADLGLQNAFGGEAMAQQVRQRILDQLAAQQQQHSQSIQDQQLQIERDRLAQEVANQTQQRQIQGEAAGNAFATGFEQSHEPGDVVNPTDPAVKRYMTIRGNILPKATGGTVPPDFGQTATDTTGQLTYPGTPKQRDAETLKTLYGQLAATPGLTPVQSIATKIGAVGGTVAPALLEQRGNSALDEARIQALSATAQHAADMARIAGENVAARGEAERAKLALEQAKLDHARSLANDKSEEWTPIPGSQATLGKDGNYYYPFSNKRGETKQVALPEGARPEKLPQGGSISDWWRNFRFGSDTSAAPPAGASSVQEWVRGADGKLHPK